MNQEDRVREIARARPMTGFFALLTPEQQKAALEYRGDEKHGDSSFLRV